MRYKVSCGVIPIHTNEKGEIKVLLVQGHGEYWGFPKGQKEAEETHRQTAVRELYEETQISCEHFFKHYRFTEQYRIPKKKGDDVMKKVIYFIGMVENTRVARQTSELQDHGWFSFHEAKEKLIASRKKILDRVANVLL